MGLVALMDPGKVSPMPRGRSGVEVLMRALDTTGDHAVDISRLCTTTWVLKGLRTKYCVMTGACIEEFDHYCIWLNRAIGKRNHRLFIVLALCELLTQVAHLYLLWTLSLSGELIPYKTFRSWILLLVTSYPLLFIIGVAHSLTAPWIVMLLVFQLQLVTKNLTTNEMLNARRCDHFWMTAPDGMSKHYRNPFNKGSVCKNCFDFWWTRRRSESAWLEHVSEV